MLDPAYKGKVLPAYTFTIERGKVREFALAIGDMNPAYFTDDPAIPPTFPTVFAFWGGGGLEKTLNEMGVQLKDVLHAEQEYEYLAPLHVGETVRVESRIADIYIKEGRAGQMQFIELRSSYTDQDGREVLRERALIIVRGQEGA